MANRSTKGGTRRLAGLASFMRVRGDIERATKSVASIKRVQVPLSAHADLARSRRVLRPAESMNPGSNQKSANDLVSALQTDGRKMMQPPEVQGEWSRSVKGVENAIPYRHIDTLTGERELASGKRLDAFNRVSAPIDSIRVMGLGLIATPAKSALSSLSAATREFSAVPILGIGNDAAGARFGLGGNGYLDLVRNSRIEKQIASHLYDEKSDVRLKPEIHRGGTNTWHVTHAPRVTVVVNGGDAAHPRNIAEQMVTALQAHHSELDQKLADAWKRKAVRDERTGF